MKLLSKILYLFSTLWMDRFLVCIHTKGKSRNEWECWLLRIRGFYFRPEELQYSAASPNRTAQTPQSRRSARGKHSFLMPQNIWKLLQKTWHMKMEGKLCPAFTGTGLELWTKGMDRARAVNKSQKVMFSLPQLWYAQRRCRSQPVYHWNGKE